MQRLSVGAGRWRGSNFVHVECSEAPILDAEGNNHVPDALCLAGLLAWPSESCDFAEVFGLEDHIGEQQRVLISEVFRVSKPGARVSVGSVLPTRQVRRLVESAGFKILAVKDDSTWTEVEGKKPG